MCCTKGYDIEHILEFKHLQTVFLLYRLNYNNDYRPMRFLSRVSMGIFYNISFLGPTLYKVALTTIYSHQKISTMYVLCSYCIVKHFC